MKKLGLLGPRQDIIYGEPYASIQGMFLFPSYREHHCGAKNYVNNQRLLGEASMPTFWSEKSVRLSNLC